MKQIFSKLTFSLVACYSIASAAESMPPESAEAPNIPEQACDPVQTFAMPYKVERGNTTVGSGEVRLAPAAAESCFTLTQTAKPNFLLRLISGPATQSSEFCTQPDGSLRSYRYDQYRTGVGSDSENYSLSFHWDEGVVRGGRFESMAIENGQTDPLLLQLRVRQWMCAGPHEPEDTLTLSFIDKRGSKQYVFAVTSHEPVTVPAGTFDSVRVERIDADDRMSRFWLDPENQYQLLKAEQQKRDDPVVRLSLTKN